MPNITVTGSLAGQFAGMLARVQGDIVFAYGTRLTAGGEDFLYTSLVGQFLSVPRTGPDALVGNVTELSLARLNLSGEGPRLQYQLEMTGLSLSGSDLFELVARTTTGVKVTFEQTALLRELNAESWRINGSDGADVIAPGALLALSRADLIQGLGGNDRLGGGAGRDSLMGGTGADSLFGGTEADRLAGGAGNDALTGGTGADVFAFAVRGNGQDRILDFQDGIDRIDLSGPRIVRDAGADTIVQIGTDSVRLVGVDRADIGWADFI